MKRLFYGLVRVFTAPIRLMLRPLKKPYRKVKKRVNQNLRWQLIVVFAICLLASVMMFFLGNSFFQKRSYYTDIDYSRSIHDMQNQSYYIVSEIYNKHINSKDKEDIESIINKHNNNNTKILISDLQGKILYKSSNAEENYIDISMVLKNSIKFNQSMNTEGYENYKGEFIAFYPLQFKDGEVSYVILKGVPIGDITRKEINRQNSFIALLWAVMFFIGLFFIITGKRVQYLQSIATTIMNMSKGDLKQRVPLIGEDELTVLAQNINFMAEELNNKIEIERELEKTKSELITNVSHDLRTPLTSILGYLNLIKDKRFSDENQLMEYSDIAYNKSVKLKKLIDELFEYTKLSGEGVKLNISLISLNELLEQLLEEFVPVFEENNLVIIKDIKKENIMLYADGEKIARVFENLLGNAIRYSYKPGEIKVGLYEEDEKVVFYISNKGNNIPKDELNKIFDRFYRVEKSRSQSTGGSGLGLAICKNIVKLHKGSICASSEGDTITFKVYLNNKTE